MKKQIVQAVLVLMMIWPAAGRSKEADTVESTTTVMDEVVVTATKTRETRKDVPNAVMVIDEMDIKGAPAFSVGELLAGRLGLDWRTYGNYGGAAQNIMIRGMKPEGTQVFVNGINVNSPSLGEADMGRIPLNNIERVEVVKGSGSLLYGTGAMGGTINILTKRPKREGLSASWGAGYGTENTYHLSAESGMFLLGDFGYYLTAQRRESDGFRDNSDVTQNDISLKFVYDKGDLLDVSLYGDWITREFGIPGPKPPEGTQDRLPYYNDETASLLDRGSDEDRHLGLQVNTRPMEELGFSFKADYSWMEGYNLSRSYSTYSESEYWSETWVTNKVLGIEGYADIKPVEGVTLLLGGEARHFDWRNKNIDVDSSGVMANDGRDLSTSGVYAEAQYRPCKYVKGSIGIRHEDHTEFGDISIPRFGLVLNPWATTTLKATHGRHFRAPTPNDLFWPETTYVKGNPDLQPEKGWHTDGTVEQSLFEDKLFLSLTGFHWELNNEIKWGELPGTYQWTPQNLRSSKATGCEFGVNIGPFFNMRIDLYYTYTDAEEVEDNPEFLARWGERRAEYTPRHQTKGDFIFVSDFGLSISLTEKYVGERVRYYNDEKDILDGYWTTDIKAEQRLFEHWTLALSVSNLLNEEYETYLSTFNSEITGYPGAGRSIFFNVAFVY